MPKQCAYCGHYDDHADRCEYGQGFIEPNNPNPGEWSSPDPEATDRAEDNYMAMLAGEEHGPW